MKSAGRNVRPYFRPTLSAILAMFLVASRLLAFVLLISPAQRLATRTPAEMERIGPGGDVRSLLINAANPQVVYIGTSSGTIYRSSDGGRSWGDSPGDRRLSFVIDTLVQHPTEPNHIYAGAWDRYSEGGGLFESTDAGTSWKQVALPVPSLAVRDLSICRSRPEIMIAGTLSGAYVTVDGGQTWKQVGGKVFEKAESVAIDPVDPDLLYVGTWRLGYKSSDFGMTWIRVDKGMPLDSDVFSIAISAKNPAVVYSSACSGVYRSSNRAQTWSRLRVHPARFTIRAQVVYIDPADPSTVYTGTTEGLFVSNDNGVKWRRLTSSNVTVNAIQVDPGNNRRILIGTEYQGVLLSEDRGKNWSESNRGFIHKQISWIVPDSITSGSFIAGVAREGAGYIRTTAGPMRGNHHLSHPAQGAFVSDTSERRASWQDRAGPVLAGRQFFHLDETEGRCRQTHCLQSCTRCRRYGRVCGNRPGNLQKPFEFAGLPRPAPEPPQSEGVVHHPIENHSRTGVCREQPRAHALLG